jgi:hypothetical protein
MTAQRHGEVPVYILRMETFNDYFKLFVKEDLIVEVEKEGIEVKNRRATDCRSLLL